MRRWRIVHTTSLTYDGQVRAAHNELRMTPVNEAGQTTLENRIRIRPMTWSHVYRDHWGTHVMAMESLASHGQLEIEAISTVERTDVARHTPSLDWAAVRDPAVQDRSYEWLMLSARTRPGDGIAELVDAVRGRETPRVAAEELASLVRAEMSYVPGSTSVHSRGEDAWAERSCRIGSQHPLPALPGAIDERSSRKGEEYARHQTQSGQQSKLYRACA